ncbi:MAG TPA: ABC transporter permease [Acidobacteriota bacterium]|nr:ABC transporter permease [Acidobacteriota bacterium]HNT16989.1 ABC transporter permease [Acidobacteriota bacterium]HPA26779.1 ABC transporter permease [Acidobacteriota bacterium]HQO20601.1 ABC transporter permease [Acidobacteriota bacterium]HQQ47450.1 ABC transporter permease [Acidobacteriota bacterium]
MRLPLFIAKRYLFARNKGAFISFITVISITGVTVGVAALIIALAISNGFTETMKSKLNEFYADINVMGFSSEMDEKAAGEVLEKLRSDPEVKGATPIILGMGLLTDGFSGVPKVARAVGIEKESHGDVVDLYRHVAGGGELTEFEDGAHGVVMGADLARSMGLEEGDTVELVVPRMTLSPFGAVPKIVVLRVTGVLRSGYYLFDNEFIYMDYALSKRLFTRGGTSAVEVRLKDPSGIADVKSRLGRDLGADFRILDLMETNSEFFKALKLERLLLFLAIGLIVIVAALNIVSTLILMVMEKVRDIGILRSMGASPGDIRLIFMLQGLFIGVLGTAIGVALGTSAAMVLDKYRVIPLSLEVYPIPYVPFHTGAGQVLLVSVFSVAISLVATVYPSRKAASLSPMEALRYE